MMTSLASITMVNDIHDPDDEKKTADSQFLFHEVSHLQLHFQFRAGAVHVNIIGVFPYLARDVERTPRLERILS